MHMIWQRGGYLHIGCGPSWAVSPVSEFHSNPLLLLLYALIWDGSLRPQIWVCIGIDGGLEAEEDSGRKEYDCDCDGGGWCCGLMPLVLM